MIETHQRQPEIATSRLRRLRPTDAALDIGEDSENGLIGVIALRSAAPETADVRYWVAPAFWGTGYAGEAVDAVADLAASEGFAALTAQAFQDNLASVKVLSRARFACEGTGESFALARGSMVATFRYRRPLHEAPGDRR
jgi:RimJ/RimL family protein N-acetyltransferase